MKLTDNTIFITGGSAGIGLALAKAFYALDGNKIIICGRNLEKLQKVQQDLPNIEIIQCDISKAEDIQQCTQKLTSHFPRLNILINNAAIINTYDFFENRSALALLEKEVETNILGPMRLTHSLLPLIHRQKSAALINITTGTAWVPMPACPGYSATKAALHSLSISLRIQLSKSHIKVFEVIPPLVDTDMSRSVSVVSNGHTKMTTDTLAKRVLKGLRRNELEMRIGMNNVLYWLHRIWPWAAQRALTTEKKSTDTRQSS